MKWALLTILLGYLVLWQAEQLAVYLLPATMVVIFIFTLVLFSDRLQALNTTHKLRVGTNILFFSLLVTGLLFLSITRQWLPVVYYPLILGLIVLSRGILKWLINLGIDQQETGSFGIMSETERGETVRSKSEKKVADWFYSNDIDYEYERKITLPGGSTILSDFYLPEHDIYVEYWGLSQADNETGEKYRARKAEKQQLYEQHSYQLLDIYPHHLYELDSYIPQQIAELTGRSSGFFAWLRRLFGRSPAPATSPIVPEETTSETAIFCTNCGHRVSQVGEYCTKCGTLAE